MPDLRHVDEGGIHQARTGGFAREAGNHLGAAFPLLQQPLYTVSLPCTSASALQSAPVWGVVVRVGTGVGVRVGVGPGVGAGSSVRVGVGNDVGVAVEVGVAVAVGIGVNVAVGVATDVNVGVSVGVGSGLAHAVTSVARRVAKTKMKYHLTIAASPIQAMMHCLRLLSRDAIAANPLPL